MFEYNFKKKMGVVLVAACLAVPQIGVVRAEVVLELLGTYKTGLFDQGGAQIVAYDARSKTVVVANTGINQLDLLDVANPAQPKKIGMIDLGAYGLGTNGVAVHDGLIAAAVEAEDPQAPGKAVFLDLEGNALSSIGVGAMPDMIVFTPDGRKVLVANEGEPNDDYSNDPQGTIFIIDVAGGAAQLDAGNVRTVDFTSMNKKGLPGGAKIGKPGQPLDLDLEPEFIGVSPDSKTAFVAVQEHNALAIIDVDAAKLRKVVGLGFKDWSELLMDASDKDGGIKLQSWPVRGMYQPDGLDVFVAQGKTYVITANEGDSREYDAFTDEARVEDLALDPAAFPNAADLVVPERLGRLKVTTTMGDVDGDGDYDELYAFGARSISIWDASGAQVWDSGDEFERKLEELLPEEFNANNDENESFDNRSDDKGAEPESVVVGSVGGRLYAFVALERVSGIMVYDVTDPRAPTFASFAINRDFAGVPEEGTAGDLAPEGLAFVAAEDSPNGRPLLIVGNEVSGTVSIYQVR